MTYPYFSIADLGGSLSGPYNPTESLMVGIISSNGSSPAWAAPAGVQNFVQVAGSSANGVTIWSRSDNQVFISGSFTASDNGTYIFSSIWSVTNPFWTLGAAHSNSTPDQTATNKVTSSATSQAATNGAADPTPNEIVFYAFWWVISKSKTATFSDTYTAQSSQVSPQTTDDGAIGGTNHSRHGCWVTYNPSTLATADKVTETITSSGTPSTCGWAIASWQPAFSYGNVTNGLFRNDAVRTRSFRW